MIGAVMRQQSPLSWAHTFHAQWSAGQQKPMNKRDSLQTLRATIRAVRLLEASADAGDKKKARELAVFLRNVWGIKTAAEVVAEGECDVLDELKAKWGDAQLPPVDATVHETSADELLIEAAVRRLG